MVSNARFYNFPHGATLSDCSHCVSEFGDSGARTTRFSNLYFHDTVNRRISWNKPNKGIFHDLDGTLTGYGADSYVTSYWIHNDLPACTLDMDIFQGIICPSPYAVQRILMHSVKGNANDELMRVWKYNDEDIEGMDD